MAVYTEIDDEALEAFLADYELGDLLSCKGIAEGVENSNFLLQTDTGAYILTIYEKRVHEEDLPFFVQLMEHLAARSLPCPTPIRARDGEALRRLMGKPAAIVTFLKGVWPKRPTAAHCAELGAAMAQLHLAGRDFPMHRGNNLSVDGWPALAAACAEGADGVVPGLRAEIESELADLTARWPYDLPAGVIHADLFPDNVFFLKDRLSGLIDFYFACNDAFAYDLAICLNAWCFERDAEFNITKARRLLAGYQQIRPLSSDELTALPLLARGAALRFLLTRLYDWLNQIDGALVKPKDPTEYLLKLRFHRSVVGPGDYGLDG